MSPVGGVIDKILTKASGNRYTDTLSSVTAPHYRIAQTVTSLSCGASFSKATTPLIISGDLRRLRVLFHSTYFAVPLRELARAAALPHRHLRFHSAYIGRCLRNGNNLSLLYLLSLP